jgi:hypothetical protein
VLERQWPDILPSIPTIDDLVIPTRRGRLAGDGMAMRNDRATVEATDLGALLANKVRFIMHTTAPSTRRPHPNASKLVLPTKNCVRIFSRSSETQRRRNRLDSEAEMRVQNSRRIYITLRHSFVLSTILACTLCISALTGENNTIFGGYCS